MHSTGFRREGHSKERACTTPSTEWPVQPEGHLLSCWRGRLTPDTLADTPSTESDHGGAGVDTKHPSRPVTRTGTGLGSSDSDVFGGTGSASVGVPQGTHQQDGHAHERGETPPEAKVPRLQGRAGSGRASEDGESRQQRFSQTSGAQTQEEPVGQV